MCQTQFFYLFNHLTCSTWWEYLFEWSKDCSIYPEASRLGFLFWITDKSSSLCRFPRSIGKLTWPSIEIGLLTINLKICYSYILLEDYLSRMSNFTIIVNTWNVKVWNKNFVLKCLRLFMLYIVQKLDASWAYNHHDSHNFEKKVQFYQN